MILLKLEGLIDKEIICDNGDCHYIGCNNYCYEDESKCRIYRNYEKKLIQSKNKSNIHGKRN